MKKLFVFVLSAFLFGCAGTTKWEPTLNSMPHKNQAAESKDLAECKDLAFQAAGYVKEGAEWAFVSAAGGAAEGAVIGALVSGAGGAGMAAAAGAPIGAIAGLWYAEYEADINYKRAYSNCLFQRGHYPIN
jgi:outer membrane lipoprotein SlyB